MDTVMITGGTGLVGKSLSAYLEKKGYKVIVLSRNPPAGRLPGSGISHARWDVDNGKMDIEALQEADHVVHLAGAGVMDKRWSASYKNIIQQSRIKSSKLLAESLAMHPNKVKSVISASAIGWYGEDNPGDAKKIKAFEETAPADEGFLGTTCRLWEESIEGAAENGRRLVKLRIGIVLSNAGGALAEFKKPLRFGIAGILGSGKQVISWIHMEDLCRMFETAIANERMLGVYNAVSPTPLSNKDFTLALAKKMRGSFFIPLHVPAFALKILLGESSIELLKSTTVSSVKIKQAGFVFLYPALEAALEELCESR